MKNPPIPLSILCWSLTGFIAFAAGKEAPISFQHVTVDDAVQIGYGIAIADMNGDAKPDIVLADKDRFVWYANPDWKPHRMTGAITERDHVCVDARDLDGDGMAEVAVGAQWNPGDTIGSGAVFYLVRGGTPTDAWTPVRLQHEPVTHRMRWFRNRRGGFDLAVLPLHGPGNRGGQGDGVRFLAYQRPADPQAPWTTEIIDQTMHLTHNFDVVDWDDQPGEELLLAGREGVVHLARDKSGWKRNRLIGADRAGAAEDRPFIGAGEVRGGRDASGRRFIATIEPMHGNQLVVYPEKSTSMRFETGTVLDDSMVQGHAIACGDLLGTGGDQIIAGWRGARRGDSTGIRMFIAPEPGASGAGSSWTTVDVDGAGMACEDLKIADMNGDGRLDIVAAGRATGNVKIYLNHRPD